MSIIDNFFVIYIIIIINPQENIMLTNNSNSRYKKKIILFTTVIPLIQKNYNDKLFAVITRSVPKIIINICIISLDNCIIQRRKTILSCALTMLIEKYNISE